MNVVSIEKVAFQVADSAIVAGIFFAQFTKRHGQRLLAILEDQARQDLALTQPALTFHARAAITELDLIVDDFQNDAYDALATVFQVLMLLPDFYYFMVECLDHEIPVYLEADLKPMGLVVPEVVVPQLTAPAIAGLLPPASEPEFPTIEVSAVKPEAVLVAGGNLVVSAPTSVVESLPADWNLDKRGRKLHGSALQARMKKYGLATA
ncbi:hypothetical protein NDA01_24685 [Trichocoleus desertorum AS-A10]|uniref:hypothetical protein n=1 Tax=Trichocoleus desertorum TaxID=1481672 RepID=UPI0032990DF7